MTRRIPIFEFNEELKSKKHQVYKSLIDGVTEAIKTNKKEEWKNSLDSALQYYINTEEYEECSKIKDLIDKL